MSATPLFCLFCEFYDIYAANYFFAFTPPPAICLLLETRGEGYTEEELLDNLSGMSVDLGYDFLYQRRGDLPKGRHWVCLFNYKHT